MKDYVNLREQYPRFLYKGYETEEDSQSLKITYQFEIPGLSSFAPAWIFPRDREMRGAGVRTDR